MPAWRGLGGFEGRSSIHTWLYRIATNRCLNALRSGGRRAVEVPARAVPLPEPTRVGEPAASPPTRRPGSPDWAGAASSRWLEPYPDSLLDDLPDQAPGPAARYDAKEAVALAFVAGLQWLPPRQRAVLLLRDVLGYHSSEVAEMLDCSESSVNSALQRARAALDQQLPRRGLNPPLPRSPRERELVTGFAEAFEADDIDRIVDLLTEDALVTMPPEPGEYRGRAAIREFLLSRVRERGGASIRLIATRANNQPAFAYYLRDDHTPIWRGYGLFVLTLEGDQISAITRFAGRRLLASFGLPRVLQD